MLEKIGFKLLHIVLGVIFFAHGWMKWEKGMDEVARWFGSVGLPEFLAYGVTWVELAGGIALILGVATRFTAMAMAAIMAGAIVTVKIPSGAGLLGTAKSGGYELDLALLAIALYISVAERSENRQIPFDKNRKNG